MDKPETHTPVQRKNQDAAQGALWGAAVGDALGTTLEFQHIECPAFPTLVKGPHTQIVGQGPFNLVAGQITDDTQMASALALSLAEHGEFHCVDVLRKYKHWATLAFDIGRQTQGALKSGGDAKQTWLDSGKRSAGNGSLMRCTPIPVVYWNNPEDCMDVSFQDAALTHYDPRCQLACAAYNASIAHAICTAQPTAQSMHSVAQSTLATAAVRLAQRDPEISVEIDQAKKELTDDLDLAEHDNPLLYPPALDGFGQAQGFVRVAFRLAYWELLHAPTYQAGVIDAVNRGGDADTNGAICGGLLGTLYGAGNIPDVWQHTVLRALDDAEPGPWRDLYHPKHFLKLLQT